MPTRVTSIVLSLSLLLLSAQSSFAAICESTDWRTKLSEEELAEPQKVLRQLVDQPETFTVISSGCVPTPLVMLQAVFAKTELEHSPGAWLRETVRCQKPPWTADPWRCSKPYTVMRFTAGGTIQTLGLPSNIEPDTMLAVGRFMASACFKSQLDALPDERRDRVKGPPAGRILSIVRERYDSDLFRIGLPYVHYIVRPVGPTVSECAFNLERIYRGGPH
jgi:hypothetical protein